ncbi:TetR family transcriptional regulator [Plantactinospora sonchi]|uniref:TetR family transcriptional regulator n=1 Tax=Plantactinospora sonchi TaxID=1544735 RepID=A0ABU7S2M0_9ACTN
MDRPPSLDTRGRILQIALDLFATRGYQRTSLREIAERLGLTKAGVLYHFPTKEHLLVALTEPLVADLESTLERAARLPWPAARWAALEGWLDTLLAHRRPLGMLFHDLAILRTGSTFTRIMRLAMQTYDLVAGAHASRIERIRAVQATAMLGDPIVFFTDVPDEVLRAEMLDGVGRLLGEPVPGRAERPATPRPAADRSAGSEDRSAESGGGSTGSGDGSASAAGAGSVPVEPATPTMDRTPTPVVAPVGRSRPTLVRMGGRRTAGRPRALSGEQVRTARALHAEGSQTVDQIAAGLGVSRATLYRHLRADGPSAEQICETDFDTI